VAIRIKNWTMYQHYKDRRPPWIKLYRDLIDDYDWNMLDPVSAKALIMLWLVGSENNGTLPAIRDLSFRLRMTEKKVESVLQDLSHWLEDGEHEELPGLEWESRYVSDATREIILERDGRKCKTCGETENLEIDHIVPISGGGNGDESNLQVLCRHCNRSKRNKSAERVATHKKNLRSLEKRRGETYKEEKETEKKKGFTPPSLEEVTEYCKARGNNVDPVKFHAHYTANGWRVGKGGLPMRSWQAAIVSTWEK
jgi:hypothetical protein